MLNSTPPGYNVNAVNSQNNQTVTTPSGLDSNPLVDPNQYKSSYATPSSYNVPSSIPVPNPYYQQQQQQQPDQQQMMAKALMGA